MLRKTKQWKLSLLQVKYWDREGLPVMTTREDELNTKGTWRD